MKSTRRDLLLALPTAAALPAMSAAPPLTAYVGTYTRDDSKGIYALRFEPDSGKLSTIGVAAEIPNPSFLTIHPNRKFLYAVGELGEFQGERSGAVHAFSIDAAAHKLKLLNSLPTGGTSPCHLVVDKTGTNLLVVNYGTGSSAVFKLKADGALDRRSGYVQHTGASVNANRQKGPHAHSVNLSKNNKFAVVADLGLDQFIVYAFDAKAGTIAAHSAAKVAPGSGPRHFHFHPSFKTAYGLSEMGSIVSVFDWNELRGELKWRDDHSTIPDGFKGNNCAEILVHPSGKFVYASNRGHNSIAMFPLTANGGIAAKAEQFSTQGKTPRNFRIDPSGRWLLAENQDSASIVVFAIDRNSGKLTPHGDALRVPFPVCLRFF